MAKRQLTLDICMGRMFKFIMWFVPLLALGAGITFTIFYLTGQYKDTVSLPALIVFDCTNVVYCATGAFFALNCEDKNKNLKPSYVFAGKIIILLVIAIQWNYISYMIPSRTFWAYFALFIFVSVFFLDSKYVLVTIGVVLVSMFLSWITKGDVLLPIRDEYFIPEVALRCVLIAFVSTMFFLIAFIVEKLLVKELENIAEYDSLTLLRNRRSLPFMMNQAIDGFNKNGEKFCFVICDIDDFKKVNDKYGHPFGDIVLKNIAKIFITSLGEKNFIFRYGGEEICCILFMDLNEAIESADIVRKRIQDKVHIQDDIKVQVTMSMGVTEYKSGMVMEDIIKLSDTNLYYAKSHGKNKVIS